MSERARWEWGIIAGKTAHGGEREGEPFAVSSPFSVKLGMHPSRALFPFVPFLRTHCRLYGIMVDAAPLRSLPAPSVLPSLVVPAQVSFGFALRFPVVKQ